LGEDKSVSEVNITVIISVELLKQTEEEEGLEDVGDLDEGAVGHDFLV